MKQGQTNKQRLISAILILTLILTLIPAALGNSGGTQPIAASSRGTLPRNFDPGLMAALDAAVSPLIAETITNPSKPRRPCRQCSQKCRRLVQCCHTRNKTCKPCTHADRYNF